MSYMDPRPEGLNKEKAPESIVEMLKMPDNKTVTFDALRQAFEKEHDMLALEWNPLGFYEDHLTQAYWEGAVWSAEHAPAAQSAGQEALFWYRPCADGLYEGPHHANSELGKMLRAEKPEAWKPLFTEQRTAGAANVPDDEGWELVRVKNLQPLLDALERAERKGYLPDAFESEWEALEIDHAAPVNGGERYAELEREHFGDPDKRTGIYAQRAADAQQMGQMSDRQIIELCKSVGVEWEGPDMCDFMGDFGRVNMAGMRAIIAAAKEQK